jgi:ubiquitin carboxyl-terminal hydrolase 8
MQNGYSGHEESVAEIKERAKEKAYSAARGSSGTTLMKVAQDRAWDAKIAEEAGDLKKALESLTQSSCLIQLLLNGAEFKNESQPGKKGVFYKEVNDWMQVRGCHRLNLYLTTRRRRKVRT